MSSLSNEELSQLHQSVAAMIEQAVGMPMLALMQDYDSVINQETGEEFEVPLQTLTAFSVTEVLLLGGESGLDVTLLPIGSEMLRAAFQDQNLVAQIEHAGMFVDPAAYEQYSGWMQFEIASLMEKFLPAIIRGIVVQQRMYSVVFLATVFGFPVPGKNFDVQALSPAAVVYLKAILSSIPREVLEKQVRVRVGADPEKTSLFSIAAVTVAQAFDFIPSADSLAESVAESMGLIEARFAALPKDYLIDLMNRVDQAILMATMLLARFETSVIAQFESYFGVEHVYVPTEVSPEAVEEPDVVPFDELDGEEEIPPEPPWLSDINFDGL